MVADPNKVTTDSPWPEFRTTLCVFSFTRPSELGNVTEEAAYHDVADVVAATSFSRVAQQDCGQSEFECTPTASWLIRNSCITTKLLSVRGRAVAPTLRRVDARSSTEPRSRRGRKY